jgi:hypothetical protein
MTYYHLLFWFSLWFGLTYGLSKKSFLRGVAAMVFWPWPLLKASCLVLVALIGLVGLGSVWLFDWGWASQPKVRGLKVKPASFEKPKTVRRLTAMKGNA